MEVCLSTSLKDTALTGWSQREKIALTKQQSVNNKVQANVCTQTSQDIFISSSAMPGMREIALESAHLCCKTEYSLFLRITAPWLLDSLDAFCISQAHWECKEQVILLNRDLNQKVLELTYLFSILSSWLLKPEKIPKHSNMFLGGELIWGAMWPLAKPSALWPSAPRSAEWGSWRKQNLRSKIWGRLQGRNALPLYPQDNTVGRLVIQFDTKHWKKAEAQPCG